LYTSEQTLGLLKSYPVLRDGVVMTLPAENNKTQDWRVLAERATSEQDPQKLTEIVEQLCHVLEQSEQKQSQQQPQRPRDAA